MPNWVIQQLVFKGEQSELDKIEEYVKSEKRRFDFNKVIPRPEEYDHTVSGTNTEFGLWLLGLTVPDQVFDLKLPPAPDSAQFEYAKVLADRIQKRKYPKPTKQPSFETKEQALIWFEENNPELIASARLSKECLDKYGYSDWYSWSIEKWGTKWNLPSTEDDEITITKEPGSLIYRFETAWSCPLPVIEKIVADFPTCTLEHTYIDGGYRFWGITNYENGQLLSDTDSDPAYLEMIEQLFGFNNDDED